MTTLASFGKRQAVPRVSVLITAYNAARFIKEAVASVLAQTMGDLELLVVDDGSADDTTALLETVADARMRLLRNETNRGPYWSANRALEAARGAFIARLDADDVALPERLAHQMAFLERTEAVGLIGSECVRIDEGGAILGMHPVPRTDAEIRLRCVMGPPFVHSSVMWRSALGLRYDETMRVAGDFELWTRALRVTAAANLPEPLVKYREWRGSLSFRERAEQERLHLFHAARFIAHQWPIDATPEQLRALRRWSTERGPRPGSMDTFVRELREANSALDTSDFERALLSPPGTYGQPAVSTT